MLQIVLRETKILLRDKGSIFFCAIFPLLLALLLGNLLSLMDTSDTPIPDITLQYVGIPDSVLPEVDGITFVRSSDFELGKDAVRGGLADAAVKFSLRGIELFNGNDPIRSRAIETIFRSVSINPLGLGASDVSYVKTKDLSHNRTMIDYYAVCMIVMILFMGSAINGAGIFYEARKDGTMRRNVICPRSRPALYIDSIISFLPQNLMQVICAMVPLMLLFHAHYADTLGGNVLLFTMFIIAGMALSALFSLVGLFIRINPTMVIMPASWVMLFCSGTFSKALILSEYMPPYVIQTAAFDLTVFGRSGKCIEVIAVSAVILIVSTAVGALLFSRKAVTER